MFSIKNKVRIRKYILSKTTGIMAAVVALVVACAGVIPRVFAVATDYSLTGGNIELQSDPEEAPFALIEFKTETGGDFYGFQGTFSPTEIKANNSDPTYFTLSALIPAGDVDPDENNPEDGKVVWLDSSYKKAMHVNANEAVWTAKYDIAENVPDGEYSFKLSEITVIGGASGYDGDDIAELTATVTISHESAEPAGKKNQVMYFERPEMDVEYGDAAFVNKFTHEQGDGAVTFSSSDTNVAEVNATTGEVTIKNVGEVTITASATETEDYNATTASFKLTVKKKSISITGVSVQNKEYDGTRETAAGDVTFDNVTLVEDTDYEIVSATFADANAGKDKTVVVVVQLKGTAADHYQLANNSFNAKAEIEQLALEENRITLNATSFAYNGTKIVPGVTVTAPTSGGITTLISGTDYTETPGENTNVGEGSITVAGIGNYKGEFTKTFTITPYTLTAVNINLEYSEVRVDGTEKRPAVTVKIGDYTVPASDCTVTYANNKEVSTVTSKAEVTVTPTSSNFVSNPVTVSFSIIDKEELSITGIANNQMIGFTGKAVELAGALTIGANDDNIKASDIKVTWYDENSTEIAQPVNVGTYTVRYSYEGANYVGNLVVNFTIVKADSGVPADLPIDLVVPVGTKLGELDYKATGFAWTDVDAVITAGDNMYTATYTRNNDTANYNTTTIQLNIFGLDEEISFDVIEGAAQEYVEEVSTEARFRIDADYALFETGGRVYVDGELLSSDKYTSESGSTIITLAQSYVYGLGSGTHTLAVLFNNGGSATTSFTVAENPAKESATVAGAPDTGAFTGRIGGIVAGIIMMPMIAGAVWIMIKVYKKFNTKKIDFKK